MIMNLKIAIIDDEQHCIDTLVHEIETHYHEKAEVVLTCSKSSEVIEKLNKTVLDVLLIDIEMPGLTGFDILNIYDLKSVFFVFTTAHSKHAIKAIDFKPEAYLLKPITRKKLIPVLEKIYTFKKKSLERVPQKLSVSTANEIEFIAYDDIIYAKANSNYTYIIRKSESDKLVSKTLKFIEEELPSSIFFRIHKSYLVNKNEVKKYKKSDGGFVEMSNGEELPVSSDKKEELLLMIKNEKI